MNRPPSQQSLWIDLSATDTECQELQTYLAHPFHDIQPVADHLPLDDEPFAADWEHYADEANRIGAWVALRSRLVQSRFPIQEGISQTEQYRAATRRGERRNVSTEAELTLYQPEALELTLESTPAGRLPVLYTPCRDDFVSLVQALAYRNEPVNIPNSMGASLVVGLNNWDRVACHRTRWTQALGHQPSLVEWSAEFARLSKRPELYQDRLVLLSAGPYSGVPAADMGVSIEQWLTLSRKIRTAHECAHYFTLRVLGATRSHLLDELIADYAGMVSAINRFRADWWLRWLGLNDAGEYRPGGRLENYRGKPPLSDAALRVLGRLTVRAARNVERLDAELRLGQGVPTGRMMLALALQGLPKLAREEAPLQTTLPASP